MLFGFIPRQSYNKILWELVSLLNVGDFWVLNQLGIWVSYITDLYWFKLHFCIAYLVGVLDALQDGVIVEADPSNAVAFLSEIEDLLLCYLVSRSFSLCFLCLVCDSPRVLGIMTSQLLLDF